MRKARSAADGVSDLARTAPALLAPRYLGRSGHSHWALLRSGSGQLYGRRRCSTSTLTWSESVWGPVTRRRGREFTGPTPRRSRSRTLIRTGACPSRWSSRISSARWWVSGAAGTALSTTCCSPPRSSTSGCGLSRCSRGFASVGRLRRHGLPATLCCEFTDGDGKKWHADVGFGLGTLLDPIPFGPDADSVHHSRGA